MTTQIATVYWVLSVSTTMYTFSPSSSCYNPHFTGVRTEVWEACIMHTAGGLDRHASLDACSLSPVRSKKRIMRIGFFGPKKRRPKAERKLHKYFLSIWRIFGGRSICLVEKRAVHGPSHISVGMGPAKRCPTWQHGCARGQSLCCEAEHQGESDEW